ncbi:3,4-dioxygenase subunit beta [Actinokineospora auranticolor]|uniref:Protocatechuate 3,4-dioxygenase beta subunit n=1 Tax=Actinokineospora auranticolor TaxID=155976 RepID=A0A2S6H1T3_9PSEU|nr:3,4-dioxygenase subunit beta [Actinokineospora auranticolor]PPK71445.1 protocatechuate 3,4-dioxygenase beta subunit [Actinokineospora auranticolor]
MNPTYEGRPLARPDDEVVDQGLAFDIATLFDRRRALRFLGLGAAGAALAGCGTSETPGGATTTTTASTASTATADGSTAGGEIPDETAGPYPGDGSNGPDVLEQSGVVRGDIRSSFGGSTTTAEGVPMTLELAVADLSAGGSALVGAAVYVWHCNRDGEYSLYGKGIENENYLRGVQITDTAGKVRFTSVFPACYDGRWPHIHFEVYPDQAAITDSTKALATSQVALPQDTCKIVYATTGYTASLTNLAKVNLTTDNVFGDDGAALQLATVTGDATSGFTVTLPVRIDPTTAPAGGSAPGGGTPPSGGPGGGGKPPSGGMPPTR